jgi:hypothetical protein
MAPLDPADRERILKDWADKAHTVPDELLDIGLDLRLVQTELLRIAVRFEATATQATTEGRPTVQIQHLRGEVETLAKIIDETILELLQKTAEVEAKSEG